MIYVLGFAFSSNFQNEFVALIRKKRGPKPVIGKLNGIGGRFEAEDRTIFHAMSREFMEETGIATAYDDWRKFAELTVQRYHAVIHCFSLTFDQPRTLEQTTDEYVGWYPVNAIHECDTVPNLRWLVPMALDQDHIVAQITDPS